MTELMLETLRAELAPAHKSRTWKLRSRVSTPRSPASTPTSRRCAQFDGLRLISRSLTVLQQETRALRAAFNDFSRTNVTAGEIEALHADVNRVRAENVELQTSLATVERLLDEMQGGPL